MHCRMFSIGIGSGASTSLVKGIARAGNGREEFVHGTDRLQAKVRVKSILDMLYFDSREQNLA